MAEVKVAIVTIQYPPTIGGLQRHIKGIVSLAESLGYNTTVITAEPNPTMEVEGELDNNVIQLPAIGWFKDAPIINPVKLYMVLKDINPKIVHVVYPFPISLDIASVYARLNKKKLVCTYIDDITVGFPINKIYEKTLWKICKYVIDSISVSSQEYGKNATGLKDWRKRFYVIPPPVFDEFNLSLSDKYNAKKKLKLEGYDRVMLFVGGLRKKLTYKRLDLLLRAWAEFNKDEKSNSIFVVIGGGELLDYYKKMASDLGLTQKNTIFKGYVPRETLIDYYLAADVFVLPSVGTNEGFGIAAVEAMFYGNAVIASDIPGIRGAVKREEKTHVSLVPPLNWKKIVDELKYWFSKDLREYALENHEYVKKFFNKERIKKELKKLYED